MYDHGFNTTGFCTVYFSAMASKYCTENGTWWRHPDSNNPWSNYTECVNHTELEVCVARAGWGHDYQSFPNHFHSANEP